MAGDTRPLPRLLVTGAGGQLGSDLARVLDADPRGLAWQGVTRAECDIADSHRVRAVLGDQARSAGEAGLVVINAAAYTDVDGAETDEAAAHAGNAAGPAHLAMVCDEIGARLVHVSTDYVFSGDRESGAPPYEVDDPTEPRTAYGRTKLDGEQGVRLLLPERGYIVRSGWLYGETGGNFVKTMLRLANERDTVDVVDDQHGAPTWTFELAERLVTLALADVPAGTYHCSAAGSATWFDVARAVFAAAGHDPDRVRPTTTAAMARPAPRPAFSVLSARSWEDAGLPPLPEWTVSLARAMARIGPALGVAPQA
ncbi:MAG TPA: dTDP-4-dehydrorhamnose reductase [Frankiaceae bacterium]|nr:dTDP-4-dehydrorhamnose reductase [Frankiaceae bacterium]